MKLHVVITASNYQHNVTVWLNPSELRWNPQVSLWYDKHAGKFERRRDQFEGFMVVACDPKDSKALPAHGSMDALSAVLVVAGVGTLESVSYLKPRESLGEI